MTEADQKKRALVQKSATHRAGIEEDVKILSERGEKVLTNLLIIGGALAISYLIVRQFASSDSKKTTHKKHGVFSQADDDEEKSPSRVSAMLSDVGTVLATQATAYLLSLAKEKLLEYLETHAEKKKPAQNDYS